MQNRSEEEKRENLLKNWNVIDNNEVSDSEESNLYNQGNEEYTELDFGHYN